MFVLTFQYSSWFTATPKDVFAFHERADALELLRPRGQRMEVLSHEGGLRLGAKVVLKVYFGPFPVTWVAMHTEFEKDRLFVDVQKSGPFDFWRHRHEFNLEKGGCRLTDSILYALPGGYLAELLFGWVTRLRLRSMFRHRHRVTRRYVEQG